MMTNRIDTATKEKYFRLIQRGEMTIQVAAEELGCSVSSLRKWAYRAGVSLRGPLSWTYSQNFIDALEVAMTLSGVRLFDAYAVGEMFDVAPRAITGRLTRCRIAIRASRFAGLLTEFDNDVATVAMAALLAGLDDVEVSMLFKIPLPIVKRMSADLATRRETMSTVTTDIRSVLVDDESVAKVGRGVRLTAPERAHIAVQHAQGISARDIAEQLGRHCTVVSREIKRNSVNGHYNAVKAEQRASENLKRPKMSKLNNPRLRKRVVKLLNKKFSPEQISGRLKRLHPYDETMQISHETIYQAIYVQGKGALRHELTVEKALRSGRKNRKPQSKLPSPGRGHRSWIGEDAHITDRPAEVEDRAVPGHWEGDLVIGSDGSTALITLIERQTRYALIKRLGLNHTSSVVSEKLAEMIKELPSQLFKTITWDQGTEMASVAKFEIASNVKVYFCDPHSPWQRGSNENLNGLIRDFYPKSTNFANVTDAEIQHMQDLLNIRPRKTLSFYTPEEKIKELIGDALTA